MSQGSNWVRNFHRGNEGPIKQMQIIHSDGLGNEEKRKDKKPLIADNIMSAILTLISEMSFVQENQLHDNDGTQLLNVLIFLTEPTQSLNKLTQ